jgi:DNA-binding response OmpR family regulator/anti-sigma regulatory factor (Ser/Thr protein kinase)
MMQNNDIKILIVDDEPGNLGIITKYLKDAGYKCSIASNGNDAVKRAGRIKPGLILLDVKMPGMDGFAVCRKLKSLKNIRDIPVIFLTALDDMNSKSKGFNEGGVDFITKPVQKEELLARVRTHLENFLYKTKLEQEVELRTKELQETNKMLSEEIIRHKETSNQLLQSEKLNVIGQLAGGIAHDFNNQLAGIIGFTELLREELTFNSMLLQYVDNILLASKRASDLTAQLLAFARRGNFVFMVINLHNIIIEVVNLLKHTIDKRIVIKQHLNAREPYTYGDSSQIQNAIMNIILNSRDAMPEGGEIVITTSQMFLDDDYCSKFTFDIKSGNYIIITVTDNGFGMDEEILNKIFEPFFTTKTQGKGTGMGLSAVYGTIKTHRGAILVNSRKNYGTEVQLYLPQYIKEDNKDEQKTENNEKPVKTVMSNIRILLIDDEPLILQSCSSLLKNTGYNVASYDNGNEAISYYKEHWKEVDLVILDLIMPEPDGKTVYYEMKKINPDTVVLLSSGYSMSGEAQLLLKEGADGFIQKPFRKLELLKTISQVLEKKSL